MSLLTRPFEFRDQIRSAPKFSVDSLPFFDALLIMVIFALQSAPYIHAPGVGISLPSLSSSIDSSVASPIVLTVDRNGLYFFEGRKLSESQVAGELESVVSRLGVVDPTLLLKADESISTSELFRLFEAARQAGFARVHLASEETRTP